MPRDEIEALADYVIALDMPIGFEKAKSPEPATTSYRQWRVDPDLQHRGHRPEPVQRIGVEARPDWDQSRPAVSCYRVNGPT